MKRPLFDAFQPSPRRCVGAHSTPFPPGGEDRVPFLSPCNRAFFALFDFVRKV